MNITAVWMLYACSNSCCFCVLMRRLLTPCLALPACLGTGDHSSVIGTILPLIALCVPAEAVAAIKVTALGVASDIALPVI